MFSQNTSSIKYLSDCQLLHYFLLSGKNHITISNLSNINPLTLQSKRGKMPGQTVFHLKRDKITFKVLIRNMTFEGWKVPSCLYGGLTIYEFKKWSKYPMTENTLTICDNYFTLNESEKSNPVHLSNIETLLMTPYISATDDITMVIYNDHMTTLKVELAITPSECKGVFINACIDKIFPVYEAYIFGFRYDLEYQNKPNRLKADCVVYQIGRQYLSEEKNLMKNNFNTIIGCKSDYTIQRQFSRLCGYREYRVKFSQVTHFSPYIPNAAWSSKTFHFRNERHVGHQVVKSLKKAHCSKSFSEEGKFRSKSTKNKKFTMWWDEPYKWDYDINMHSTDNNGSRHVTSTQSFKEINTNSDEVKHQYKDRFYNLFSIIFGPISKVFITVVLKPLRRSFCEPLRSSGKDIQNIHSKLVLCPNRQICLSDIIRKPSHFGLLLEIRLKNFSINEYFIGKIMVNSLMCNKTWLKKLTSCEPGTAKKLYLHWEANITTGMLLYSANTLLVNVFGHIYSAKLETSSGSSCKNNTCLLEYRWKYSNDLLDFSHGYHLTDINSKEKSYHENITWNEADQICQRKGAALPTIFSDHDLKELLKTLVKTWKNYMSVIFLGIQKRVRRNAFNLIVELKFVIGKLIRISLQYESQLRWSDNKPVGLQMWGYPYNPPTIMGRQCVYSFDDNQSSG